LILLDLLRQTLRTVHIRATTTKHSPTSGKRWLILGGVVNHITGTDTALEVKDKLSQKTIYRNIIPSASASAELPLFHMYPEVHTAQFSWYILDDTMEMVASALGAGAYITVEVLEFTE